MRTGTVAFLLGIVLLMQFSGLPDVRWSLLLLPSIVLLVLCPRLSFPAALVCGFLWALWHADRILSTTLPLSLQGRDVTVTGVIASLPDTTARRKRFDMDIQSLRQGARHYPFHGKARISWYGGRAADLHAGERWQLRVRLKRPAGFSNPGGFDYEQWLFRQHIRVTGYVRPGNENRYLDRPPGYWLLGVRQLLARQLLQGLADNPYGGVITALAIGDRQGISPEQWRTMGRTGITHLVAISGLHIGLVAGLVFVVWRRIWSQMETLCLKWPAPKAAALASAVAALSYAALAGFSIPAQRALVMVFVILVGVLTDRQRFPSQSLSLALLAVLIYDPLAVLSPGFWLSFAAVAAIMLAMTGRLGSEGRLRKYTRLHTAVFIGLLPVLLVIFRQLPLLSPFANLISVPWVSLVVVPLTLIGTVFLVLLPVPGIAILNTAGQAMGLLWRLIEPLAGVDFGQWSQADIPPWAWVLLIPATIVLLLPKGVPGKWLGMIILLPVMWYHPPRPDSGSLWLTLLDVGQGLATVIETAGHVMVYDTGPRFSERFDAGHAVLLPFLRRRGVQAVDMLVIGHGDRDHIGGLAALLDNMPVRHILTSVPEKTGHAAQRCRQGQRWYWSGILFEVLQPDSDAVTALQGNNASCVVRISLGKQHVLLTGDIEKQAEHRLLARYPDRLPADILVVPHHGSLTSSTPEFVDKVNPVIALFPAGYLNRYGFPRKAVIARYQRLGTKLYETGRDGAITIRLKTGYPPQVERYREESRRFWQRR